MPVDGRDQASQSQTLTAMAPKTRAAACFSIWTGGRRHQQL